MNYFYLYLYFIMSVINSSRDILQHRCQFLHWTEQRNLVLTCTTLYKKRPRNSIHSLKILDRNANLSIFNLKQRSNPTAFVRCLKCYTHFHPRSKKGKKHTKKCNGLKQCPYCWKWMDANNAHIEMCRHNLFYNGRSLRSKCWNCGDNTAKKCKYRDSYVCEDWYCKHICRKSYP